MVTPHFFVLPHATKLMKATSMVAASTIVFASCPPFLQTPHTHVVVARTVGLKAWQTYLTAVDEAARHLIEARILHG